MRALAILLSIALFAGCTQRTEAPRPPDPAPPDVKPTEAPMGPAPLKVLARAEIHEAMRKMVVETEALSELLTTNAAPDAAAHKAIEARVMTIDRVLAELDASSLAKTHPLLGEGLPGFRRDVGLSLDALKQSPPDYAPARGIPAACKGCHVVATLLISGDTRMARR